MLSNSSAPAPHCQPPAAARAAPPRAPAAKLAAVVVHVVVLPSDVRTLTTMRAWRDAPLLPSAERVVRAPARRAATSASASGAPVAAAAASAEELPGTGSMSGHPLPRWIAKALGPEGTSASVTSYAL